MKKEEALLYDLPSIVEYVSWGWLQTILARYVAWKVTRKINRYNKRIERKKWIESLIK